MNLIEFILIVIFILLLYTSAAVLLKNASQSSKTFSITILKLNSLNIT